MAMLSNIASGIRTLLQSVPGMQNGAIESQFWQRKMLTHFNVMDIDKDGYVSRTDVKELVKILGIRGELGEKRTFLMQRLMIQLWEDFWCCGEDKGFDYLLPPEEFLNLINTLTKLTDCKKHLEEPLALLFGVIDLDSNGLVNLREWSLYYQAIGLNENDAAKSFTKCFDRKEGITKADFIAVGQSFFTTKDERHSSQYLWGPLVD